MAMGFRCVPKRQNLASFPSQLSLPTYPRWELFFTRPNSVQFMFPALKSKRQGFRRHRISVCQATLLQGPAIVLVVVAAAAATATVLPLYLFGDRRRDRVGARALDETEMTKDLDAPENLASRKSEGVTSNTFSTEEDSIHGCPDVHNFRQQKMESANSIHISVDEMNYTDGNLSCSKGTSSSEPKTDENDLGEEEQSHEEQLEGLGFDVPTSTSVHHSDEILKQTVQHMISGVSGELDSNSLLVTKDLLADNPGEARQDGDLSELTSLPVIPHVIYGNSDELGSNSLLVTKEHLPVDAPIETKQDGSISGLISMPVPVLNSSLVTLEAVHAQTDTGDISGHGASTGAEPQVHDMNGSPDGLHSADSVIVFEEGKPMEGSQRHGDLNIDRENGNGFSPLQRHLQRTGVKQLVQDSLLATGNSVKLSEAPVGNVVISSNEQSFVSERNGSVRPKGDVERTGRSSINTKDGRNLMSSHLLLEIEEKDEKNPTKYISIYNHLLSDGSECIGLLEIMRTRYLLDMDKVYHARFLMACKIQKAVKDAFHFVKLIKRPSLSTFNMLMSVCARSQDSEGAFKVLSLVREAGLKADCKLYTTLISTCAKSRKVDAMFEVFHKMVNAGVEPNLHTYGALIDGCAKAGQMAKAFGAYGIMRSKKVNPDRVVFNALITACGQSGAVDRAFDVLAEMRSEPQPIDPDHVTIGALMRICSQAGQADRALEVYKMMHQYNIKGTPEVYTIAINCCSLKGDLDHALTIYKDMKSKGVIPDEVFFSALIDVAGHAGKIDAAFKILQNARRQGIELGNISYSSLMGACCNRALELYVDMKAMKLLPSVSTMNALITSLCEGDQLQKSVDILAEMEELGVSSNSITYVILLVACEKKGEVELAFKLLMQAKKDRIVSNLIMCKCFTGLCLQRFQKASSLGEPVVSFNSGNAKIDNQWTSWALTVYRDSMSSGIMPTVEIVSQVLGCLQIPYDASLRSRIIDNLGLNPDVSRYSNLCSLLDGFGEYDPRAFFLLEEAASLGVVPCVSFKGSPITVDARELQVHIVEVYLLTILKGLRHRLAAGAKLPSIMILLRIEETPISSEEHKIVCLSGRVGQSVGALLRRLNLSYQGSESSGKIRISGLSLKRWFQPRLEYLYHGQRPTELTSFPSRLARGITDQQRNIRTSNLSLD